LELEFLDTNVILRLMTRDNQEQGERSYHLFQEVAAGKPSLVTSESVIVEAVYVLSSAVLYNLPRQKIKDDLSTVVSLPGLQVPRKRAILRALDLYASTTLDFVDALNVEYVRDMGLTTIVSFDRDFDRIPGIQRREP
jgi:predicted nucleic-acid-binding protein